MISLAHAQVAAGAPPSSDLMSFVPMIIILGVFWFLMIRPQMKRAKEHKALLSALQKGDEVITQGGLAGRVIKVDDNYVTLEVAAKSDASCEIIVQKPAVTLVLPKGTLKTL